MLQGLSARKFIITIFLAAALVTPAAAEWNVTVVDAPENVYDSPGGDIFLSDQAKSFVLVKLETESGEPVTEQSWTDSSQFNYKYNKSAAPLEAMTHYHDEYWYAEHLADEEKHGLSGNKAKIFFEANGDTNPNDGVDSDGYKNTTETLMIGNYDVSTEKDLDKEFVPGTETELTINVTNTSNDAQVKDATVGAYFTNGSYNSNKFTLNYNESRNIYFNEAVKIPDGSSKRYVLRMIASNQSGRTSDSLGSLSRLVDTKPKLMGQVENLTADQGCETNNNVVRCESGAIISTKFNVTSSSADSVNLTGYKVRRSDGQLVEYFNRSLSYEGYSIYSGEFGMPGLNTSKYNSEIVLKYNATKNQRYFTTQETVNYESFLLRNTGSYESEQGQNYTVEFFGAKPYTLMRYGKTRFSNLTVDVTDSQGEHFTTINKSELTFNRTDDVFKEKIQIPDEAPTGGWDFMVNATNVYSESKQIDWRVSIDQVDTDPDVPFNVSDTTLEQDEMGVQEFDINVTNFMDGNITIDTNRSEELEGVLNISEDGQFNVSAGAEEEIPITVNQTEFNNVSGTVNFTNDTLGYSKEIQLNITTPDCTMINNSLCSLTEEPINVTIDSSGSKTRNITLLYTAGEEAETNITTNVTGNISEHIQVDEQYEIEDYRDIQLTYSAEEALNASGTVEVETDSGTLLTFDTNLEANISQPEEEGLTATPTQLDLGAFPEGEDREADIMLENTGNIPIENITTSSETFNVSANQTGFTIAEGETTNLSLTFQNITADEGTVNLTGDSTDDSVNIQISVNATALPNYKNKVEDLRGRIESVRPIYKPNLTQTVTEVSGIYTQISTAWDSGNYLEARSYYNEADSLVTYIENNVETSTGGDTGGDTGDTGDDTGSDTGDTGDTGGDTGDTGDGTTGGNTGGNTGGDTGGTTGQQQQNDGGGLPIIPIVVVLLLLIVGGFVFYESYIPEEGDPLYGVLGRPIMSIVQTIQSMPQGVTSFILVGLLIAVLVVAYKIMEMVFETLTVATLSGVFYGALTYLFSPEMQGFEVNELLLFVFLGAALYMGYSFLLSLYSATSTLIDIPIEMFKIIVYPFKKLWGRHKKKSEKRKEKKQERKEKKQEEQEDQSTKEVVLDKVKEEDDEDEQ